MDLHEGSGLIDEEDASCWDRTTTATRTLSVLGRQRKDGAVIEAHDLLSAVDTRTPMVIGEGTTAADEAASRATLGRMNNASVGIQRYQGVPPWEIHRDADELLYVLDGDMELTVAGDGGPETVSVPGGSIVIVPKGRWHRPVAKTMVTLLSATPSTNSDIAFSEFPP